MSSKRNKSTGLIKFINTLLYIREHPDCTAKQIKLDTGIAYSTIEHHIDLLLKSNFIYKTYNCRKGASYRELTEKAKEELKFVKEPIENVETTMLFP